MATLSKWSTSIIQHFSYSYGYPQVLKEPQSVSIYVYDPTNTVVYTDNRPLPGINPQTGQPWGVGVYEFHVPGTAFLAPTVPEGYYQVVTVAQFPDGSTSGNAETVSVV